VRENQLSTFDTSAHNTVNDQWPYGPHLIKPWRIFFSFFRKAKWDSLSVLTSLPGASTSRVYHTVRTHVFTQSIFLVQHFHFSLPPPSLPSFSSPPFPSSFLTRNLRFCFLFSRECNISRRQTKLRAQNWTSRKSREVNVNLGLSFLSQRVALVNTRKDKIIHISVNMIVILNCSVGVFL